MAGRDSEVSIVITARDEASRVLQDLKNKLVIFDEYGKAASVMSTETERTTRSITSFDAGMVKTARNVRELVIPAFIGLEPALRGMSRDMTQALAAATSFAGGLAGAALALTGIAGVIGGQLLDSWRRNREEMQRFNQEIGSMDMGRIASEATKARRALEPLRAELEANRLAFEAMKAREQEALSGPGGGLFGRSGTGAGRTSYGASTRREIANTEAQYLQAIELLALGQGDTMSGQAAAFRYQNNLARRGAYDFLLNDPIEEEYTASLRRADDLSRGTGFPFADPGAATRDLQRATVVRNERRRLKALERFRDNAANYDESLAFADPTRANAISEAEAVRRRFDELGGANYDESLAFADPTIANAMSSIRAAREQGAAGSTRARLALDLYGGLSARDRYSYGLRAIAAERDSRLSDISLLPDQRSLITEEAGVRGALLTRGELERTDGVAGLMAGFREIQDAAESTGLVMQQFARDTSSSMASAFSDGFFNLMTGKFRSLEDTVKGFGLSLARSVSDALGQVAANQLLSGFGGLFGGSANGVPFAGNGALSLFAGGGAPGFGGGYGGGFGSGMGGPNFLGRGPVDSYGDIGGAVGGFGGPMYSGGGGGGFGGVSLSALLGLGLQNYGAISGNPAISAQGGGISALYNAGQLYSMYAPGAGAGFGVTAAGFYGSVAGLGGGLLSLAGGLAGNRQLTNAGALLSMVSTGIGLAGAVGAASAAGATAATTGAAGFLAAEAAATAAGAAAAGGAAAGGGLLSVAAAAGPYAAAAIIAALSIYNQTQLAGNWKSLPPSVKTGARVGAALGPGSSLPYLLGIDADVSGYFDPAFTYAGSLIGGFFVDSPSRRVREQINVATVLNPSAQAIIAHVNAAKTPLELWNTLVSWGSGYTGGTSSLAFSITVNGRTIGTANAYYDVATMDDLLEAPETVRVNVQLGVPQHYKDDVNRAVEDAIRAKVAALNAIFGAAPIGYTERIGGGGVSRATVEPFDPIALRGRGLALSGLSREQLRQIFDDDDLVETWLRRAVRVNGERQLGLLQPDGFPA